MEEHPQAATPSTLDHNHIRHSLAAQRQKQWNGLLEKEIEKQPFSGKPYTQPQERSEDIESKSQPDDSPPLPPQAYRS
jgi:hypothetical protein